MLKICGLWKNDAKDGKAAFMSGLIELPVELNIPVSGVKLVIIERADVKGKEPDYDVFLAPIDRGRR